MFECAEGRIEAAEHHCRWLGLWRHASFRYSCWTLRKLDELLQVIRLLRTASFERPLTPLQPHTVLGICTLNAAVPLTRRYASPAQRELGAQYSSDLT